MMAFLLIPIEVKANDNSTASLNQLIDSDRYSEININNYKIRVKNI